jgi:uncharacterized protein
MKTSLTHLPEHIQSELQRITETIVKLVTPEMVILFGSYARGNYVEHHRYIENGITYEYKSDYDILVVTKHHQDMPPRLEKETRRKVKKAENLQTSPHIIYHDIKFLNNELSDGNYFFVDIAKEGVMLHNSGNFELVEPRILSPKERSHKAQVYYDSWFKDAEDSFRHYSYAMNDKSYKKAVFELHQTTERLFMTILLIFTDYKPKIHDLIELNIKAGYTDARIKTIFPEQTEEEKRLFSLLVKAYIDSRYKLGYTIDPEDLQYLAERVQQLKQLTESVCKEKIESYTE